jgi:type II secretory pathway component PulF
MLLFVATFLAVGPIPVLSHITSDPHLHTFTTGYPQRGFPIPDLSSFVTHIALFIPWICGAILLLIALMAPAWWLMGRLGLRANITDAFLSRIPLLGPVLWRSALARWCNAVHIATDAGLDLPQSIDLAGKLVAWKRLQQDSSDMIHALAAGQPLQDSAITTWRIIPPSVRIALQLASERHDLPTAARTLGEVYQHEAESRAAALSGILSPILLIMIALLILFVIGGLLSPLVRLFHALT